jgi:para-aminobenzoate synthetase component 1
MSQSEIDTVFPIAEEIDSLDPQETFLRLASLPHVLFLDSAARNPTLGRYSFLSADPFEFIEARGREICLESTRTVLADLDPFSFLADQLTQFPSRHRAELPPFQAGAAGLWGYDLCHHIENLPYSRYDEFKVPDLAIGLYDWTIGWDHVARRTWLISTGYPEQEPDRRRRLALQRVTFVKELLANGSGRVSQSPNARKIRPNVCFPVAASRAVQSSFDEPGYLGAVRRAIAYIHAGDCFQVNLAQRLLARAPHSSVQLYLRLRSCNPAPFAGFFDLGEFQLASASPERFLRLCAKDVETRPIKGTRPRGQTEQEDEALRCNLENSPKDRAENIMIVDLLRNDLGRVCRYGTIRVPVLCGIESYEHVHHLVSVVRGELRPELGMIDLLRAAFPGGSVTGAPKIRAMEIIAELEPTARGPYCGSLGYIGFSGHADTNILIRTFCIGGGWAQFPVGGGIVADSDPAGEYAETWDKARGLLQALTE